MEVKMVNLAELVHYHPYHSSTFARYANVTTELLWAGIRGEEELTRREIIGISVNSGVPVGVITCPGVIWLDRNSYRHRKMIRDFEKKFLLIRDEYEFGNEDAAYFVRRNGMEQGNLLIADFWNDGKVTYCRYLGTMAFVDMVLGWIHKAEPRGLRKNQKGGAA
jgi:hypothetical protein|nr:hypothetical protein [uncultured Acetatifactor sp.]